jgi:hypothetical protein
MIDAIAFDFESHLIGPDKCPCGEIHGQLPPAVCMSWALPDGRSDVVTAREGLEILDECLADPNCHLVGAETAFDSLLSCVSSDDFDAWIARWVAAYNAGRVHDVLIRQKLLDLAAGTYRWHTYSDGKRRRIGYDLATTAERTVNIRLDKPTKENRDVHPRLRYAEYDGVPIAEWPANFVEYAREDATATMAVYLWQESYQDTRLGRTIADLWGGHTIAPFEQEPDVFDNVTEQTRNALWLKAMSAEGLCVDPVALARFERVTQREYVALCAEVRGYGLARREYWRDLKRLRELKSPYAQNAAWREFKEELDVDLPEALAAWDELHAQGLVRSKHVKNQKVARALMYDVCRATNQEVPHTDKWDEDHDSDDVKIAIDADACRRIAEGAAAIDSRGPRLQAYAELVHTAKMLTTDIKQLRQGVDRPIHTHFEVCLETGRTSSSSPNVQNRARGEGKTVKLRDGTEREGRPGDRECFVPPEGCVFIDCDYPQLELFCLAQVCKWLLGYSTLGDALNGNVDPHTDFAALIVSYQTKLPRLPYKRAEEALKDKLHPLHAKLKDARQAAKGCNFGRPGGLGAKTLVVYAAKSYGVVLPESEWSEILELWDQQWTEMPDYFAFVNGLETGEDTGEYCVPQVYSGRLRAGATYCAACNSFYQGLGADVAKRAGWYIFQACYVKGFDNDLFGCMPQNFVHDQFFVAAPEAKAQAAALRVEHWMRQAAIELLPDYGEAMAKKTEAILARRWSKGAEAVRGEDGSLGVWEDARLMIDDFDSDSDDESEAA